MSDINVLDSSIYNRISAGEVVERPRSVVKELVENSIDAGATIINVSIECGGTRSIIVSDNGSGITKDNIKKAFLPHATSKITSVDDLDKISTLGFRGEALASIAAVSQVTVRSKTSDSIGATLLEVNGGAFGELTECALNVGTTMEVKNLFYNTPVRAKFLKKPKSEENEVTACIKEFILTNPDIVFIYKVDGRVVYQNSGASMEDALYAVYPREIVDHFIPFDVTVHSIRVYGYVASPEVSKPTRSYQTIICNGRFIKDSQVSIAVQNAFGERLMKRTFPVFVINMIVPFDEVDVNVHPSKTEVRFIDNRRIFGAVYRAIQEALIRGETIFSLSTRNSTEDDEGMDLSTNACLAKDVNAPSIARNDTLCAIDNDNNEKISTHNIDNDMVVTAQQHSESMCNEQNERMKGECHESCSTRIGNDVHNNNHESSPITFEGLTGKSYDNSSFERFKNTSTAGRVRESAYSMPHCFEQVSFIDDIITDASDNATVNGYRIVGQIFKSFLILEYKGDVLLLDQHACHERLLYDKLIEECDNKNIVREQLLLPYILTVSPEDDSFIRDNIELLDSFGFGVSPFRDYQYRVDSVPHVLSHINLELFFNTFLEEKNKYRQVKFTELLHQKLATTACKAAIKAGNELNDEQIKMLISILTENEIPLQCPHGRPAVIKITRKDIDKLFKRIV